MSLMDMIPKKIQPFAFLCTSATFVYLLDKYLVRNWLEKYYRAKAIENNVDLIDLTKSVVFRVSSKPCPMCISEKGNWEVVSCSNMECNAGKYKYLLDFIRNAKSSIDICMYSFRSHLSRIALEEASRRGVVIRLILDCEHAFSAGSFRREFLNIGIPVRVNSNSHHFMHHKMIIVDNEILITGSLNLTDNAIFNNHETVILLSRPCVVNEFAQVFQEMWEQFV